MAQHCKTNASSDRGLQQGMHKNQLQELAQRSCFNLPSYSCIREGPDHAPRFKATVNFNGETFESPNYCTTLRQAEHAAAEVALNTLCKRGPSQMLAARILDETGVCKNLLQETAQRAGVSLPVYTTVRVGPGHVPVFKCIVEVGGRIFVGELAKTKKQAEKNAAMAAWSAIKQLPLLGDSDAAHEEADRSSSSGSNALTLYGGGRESSKGYGASLFHSHRSRARGGGSRSRLKRDGSPAGSSGPQFYRGNGVGASAAIGAEMGLLDGGTHGRLMFNQNQSHEVVGSKGNDALRTLLQQQHHPHHHHHHRSHPSAVSGVSSPSLLSRDAPSWATGGGSPTLGGGSCVSSPLQHHQKSRLSWQSRSDRYELRRPDLMEELQLLGREDDDWLRAEDHNQLYLQQQQQLQAQQQQQQQLSSGNALLQRRRPMFQSQSERFELRQTLLDELYQREEEEWLRAEVRSPRLVDRDRMPIDYRNTPYSLFSDGSGKSYGEFNDCETSYRSEYSNGTQSYNSCYGDSSNASFTASFSSNPSVISGHGARYNGSFNSVDGPGAIGSPYPLQLNESQQLGFSSAVERPSAANNYSSIGETGKPLACYVVGGGYGTGGVYDVINADTKASSITSTIACAPSNAAVAPSSSSSSSSSSSASSLWSRSAQWWGSHRPSSPSSAAAAVAHSFLGLGNMRPASSLAPPVRVRHMVAVCSAPPPRCNSSNVTAPSSSTDASIALPHHRPHRDISDRGESSTLQLLEQLRL